MKIYAPYCFLCRHGRSLEECVSCTAWLRWNSKRIEKGWGRRFRMWEAGHSHNTPTADMVENHYIAIYRIIYREEA